MRKPFYMKKVRAWYVWFQGRQVKLDTDKTRAYEKYHELMAGQAPVAPTDTVASLCNVYLDWCQSNRDKATYAAYQHYLSSFVRCVGLRLSIRDLKPMHVSNWLSAQSTWNATTQHKAVRAVKRVFNWAKKEGRLSENPLRDAVAPAPRRREHAITPEQHKLVVSLVNDQNFQDYLTLLYETGARPEEVRRIEANHCQLDASRVVLPPSDAKGRQDYRVIHLTPTAAQLVRRLCDQSPDGPILRTTRGTAWTKDSVNCRFRRLKAKLAEQNQSIPGVCATSWRHGFATEALKRGVDPVTVSILMGHKDTTMVARIYQHLATDADYLSTSLSRIRDQSK